MVVLCGDTGRIATALTIIVMEYLACILAGWQPQQY